MLPLLAEVAEWRDHLTPVARVNAYYDAGTPQAALLAAIDSRYPDSREAFFKKVAERCSVTPESASGTFYGFLRANRPLPKDHAHAYQQLLDIDSSLLEEIASLRQPPLTQKRRDLLEELEAKVGALTTALEASRRSHEALRRRVAVLEKARPATQPRSRPVGQAKRPGRKTA